MTNVVQSHSWIISRNGCLHKRDIDIGLGECYTNKSSGMVTLKYNAHSFGVKKKTPLAVHNKNVELEVFFLNRLVIEHSLEILFINPCTEDVNNNELQLKWYFLH